MKFEILSTEQAVALRKAFIQQFVDTTSEHYQTHIATLIQDIDDFYYDGTYGTAYKIIKSGKKNVAWKMPLHF